MKLVDRLRSLPLPVGTIPVAIGLGLAGLMQYGFLVVAARALGTARFAPLSVFWALLFVCGPGFFLPLEQETGRAIAARRVRGEGGRPVFVRAAMLGGVLMVVLIVATLAMASPIDQHVFKGDPALLAGLVGGFAAYLCEFLARGALAGNARFGAYGVLLGGEGALRVAFAAILAVVGVLVALPMVVKPQREGGSAAARAAVVAASLEVVLAIVIPPAQQWPVAPLWVVGLVAVTAAYAVLLRLFRSATQTEPGYLFLLAGACSVAASVTAVLAAHA